MVAEYLEIIQPGCEYTITGGYRRGKPASNDIDIVISHRELGKEKHILSKLVAALTSDGTFEMIFPEFCFCHYDMNNLNPDYVKELLCVTYIPPTRVL